MSQKELIISLIQQDLKHSQLILGLDELGMDASDKHSLEILDVVANLMQVPDGEIEYDSLRGCCAVVSPVRDLYARMQNGRSDAHFGNDEAFCRSVLQWFGGDC